MATGWPAAALLACTLGLAAALSCKPCEQTTCGEVKCAGRMVRDVCDCCLVCARAAGQPCGGYFDSLGVCDDELVCQTSPRLGQSVDTGAEGVCTKNTTDCQYQLCQLMLGTCVCTELDECRSPDVGGDPTTFTSREECQKAAKSSQLSPTAAVTPPAAVPTCPGVDCDPGATSCPADSVLKTTPPTRPDCCPPVGVCLCDLESCSAAAGCPAGQQAVQVSAGRQQPGLCCSRWQCKAPAPQTNLSCSHDGNTYGAGDTWQSKCTVCQCKDGLTFCQSVECPTVAHCAGKVTHRADQCCRQCVDGCLSPSGVHHNSSEQWLEDDCTTCSCLAGSLSCQSEMCHISCRNPRPVPGRCCPVCDECDVRCQHGYRTSQDGRQLCQCLTAAEVDVPPPACRSMATCRRQCPHGFKVDDNGCERCKCKKCRKLKGCTKKCAYGLMTDDRECAICRCRSHASGRPGTAGLDGRELSCVTADGSMYEEGEQWHDGCRQCYCHGGLEMCSIISCPVPRCDKPEIADGRCCPTCPDGPGHPSRLNVTVCQAVDGRTYVEGQLWQLDACTRCVCHSGRVLCSSPACAPAPCASPDRPVGDCCATCAVAPSGVDRQTAGCRDENGVARSRGETWRQGACVSCLCQGGEVSCFHEKCRPLDCDRPVLKKGRCCPFCLEAPRSSHCVHRNRTMATGQTWDLDPCTTCTCENGDTVCMHKTCAETCTETAADPADCCPTCKEDGAARGSVHPLAGVSKATHRTVVRAPPSPTQTSHHGVERQPGESQSSHQYIVLCVVIGCLVLVLLAVLVVWWVRRQRSGYSPKHITEEKKPLNDPQIMHFVRLDGRGLHQDTLILEKNGAVVREA